MRRLLVTGGAGFIGANFVRYWLKQHADDRVVVLDALTYAGNVLSLMEVQAGEMFLFVHGDIRDQALVEEVLGSERIDTIVHFAAESNVDRSIEGPDIFIETNVIGTHCLLKATRRMWPVGDGAIRRFHHVSTDEVYGSLGSDDPPFTEIARYAPSSPYAASKAASDHLVRSYHHTYGLPVTISNCSNNYGPFQFPEKLIPRMLVNVLQGIALPVYGDGLNVRDWLHVDDHCRGIDRVIDSGRVAETYNIGGGSVRSNIQVVTQICSIVDDLFHRNPSLCEHFPRTPAARGERCRSLISFVRDRPGHDQRYGIDCTRIARELNFAAERSFSEGLASTVAWYVANEWWWRSASDLHGVPSGGSA